MKKANLSLFDHLLMYSPSSSKRLTYRSTQIMATVGPETTKDDLVKMVEAGMNIARFEALNGKDDFPIIKESLKNLREAVSEYNGNRKKESERQSLRLSHVEDTEVKSEQVPNVHVATALDIKSSYFETGTFDGAENKNLEVDAEVFLTLDATKENLVNEETIFVNYPNLCLLDPNQIIIVNGEIKLRVDAAFPDNNNVKCKVLRGGVLCANMRMEVNIPGSKISPSMNEDLIPSINFCKDNIMDMMITPINDVNAFAMIKCFANPDGDLCPLKIIAKLEGGEAVRNIDKIIERADGVMISRSRLGRNILPERVIVYQKSIIAKCLKAGLPSIIAYDVMKSMEQPDQDATRAEIADVANSVFDGCDCIMLEEKVSMQNAIKATSTTIMEAEDSINYRRLHWDLVSQVSIPQISIPSRDFPNSIAIAACTAAMVNGANVIVVLTETGRTARMISKYRPECPIICVSRNEVVARQLLMCRGVFAITYDASKTDNYVKSVEERIQSGISFAKSLLLIKQTGVVVAVSGQVDGAGKTDTLRLIFVDKEKKPEENKEEEN